jgi:ankyrin repeat protein
VTAVVTATASVEFIRRTLNARTALMTACEYGQLEAAQALLDSGAVPAAELSLTAAVHCDDEATAVQLCRALLAKGAAVDATECGRTALALAALQGKTAVAAVLLRAGADVNAVCIDSDGLATSVLQYAVMGRSAAIVKALLVRGVSAAAVDSDGSLPLHLAAYRSTADVTRLLLAATAAAGIDAVRARVADLSGYTPLLCAVSTGNTAAVRELLQQGAKAVIDVPSRGGRTPLMAALSHTAVLKLLLEAGADATAVSQRTGNSALHEGETNVQYCSLLLLLLCLYTLSCSMSITPCSLKTVLC